MVRNSKEVIDLIGTIGNDIFVEVESFNRIVNKVADFGASGFIIEGAEIRNSSGFKSLQMKNKDLRRLKELHSFESLLMLFANIAVPFIVFVENLFIGENAQTIVDCNALFLASFSNGRFLQKAFLQFKIFMINRRRKNQLNFKC